MYKCSLCRTRTRLGRQHGVQGAKGCHSRGGAKEGCAKAKDGASRSGRRCREGGSVIIVFISVGIVIVRACPSLVLGIQLRTISQKKINGSKTFFSHHRLHHHQSCFFACSWDATVDNIRGKKTNKSETFFSQKPISFHHFSQHCS